MQEMRIEKKAQAVDWAEQQDSTEDDWSATRHRVRIGNNKAHRSKADRTNHRKAVKASKRRNRK